MGKNNNVCPVCSSKALTKETINEEFEYKGKKLIIENYIIYRCADCEEEIVDEKTLKDTEKRLVEFHRKVDNLLTPDEIKTIRRSLGYTQESLGMILGGGKKAFARYENGTITQTRAMDNQMKMLRRHPELLDEIKGGKPNKIRLPEIDLCLEKKYEKDSGSIFVDISKDLISGLRLTMANSLPNFRINDSSMTTAG